MAEPIVSEDRVVQVLKKLGRPAVASEIYEEGEFDGIQGLYVGLGNYVKKEGGPIVREKQEDGVKFAYALRAWGGSVPISRPGGAGPVLLKAGRQAPARRACKPALKLEPPNTESNLVKALVGLKEERDAIDAKRVKLNNVILAIEALL